MLPSILQTQQKQRTKEEDWPGVRITQYFYFNAQPYFLRDLSKIVDRVVPNS